MLLSIWTRIRASETASGEDEWVFGGAWSTWSAGFRAGIPVWIGLGRWGMDWGKEFVKGVQRLGHGNRELEWRWRGRMVCKGCRA